jgi:hypothetical protein
MRAHIPLQGSRVKPGSFAWWARVLTALVFVFQVYYIQFHLLVEKHLDDRSVSVASSVVKIGEHGEADGHHGHDHHHPEHPGSDHVISMVAKHPSSCLDFSILQAQTSICCAEACRSKVAPNAEVWKWASESPPDPAQPRGPPLS